MEMKGGGGTKGGGKLRTPFFTSALRSPHSLTRSDAPDVADAFGEPHSSIWRRRNIGRAAAGCGRREQADGTAGRDAPDCAHFRIPIFICKPEIAVRPSRDAVQEEVIIARTGQRK